MTEPVIMTTIDRAAHTVLVVDDNPGTRYSTARSLRAAGFRTAEASTGAEAIDLATRGGVSAIVLDVHLPDIDGFEVCRVIRSNHATRLLPIVHLSAAYVRNEDHVTGLNAGADGYLVHPVEPALLVATLQALIRARSAEDELEQRREEMLEREQAARALAERHSRTKDDFIAVLSHELRTPLNAIMGWVHILKRRGITPEGMRGLTAIERNVQAQARIISDILDVSRINSGKLRLERQWVDPAALVLDSVAELEPTLRERRLQVVAEVAGAHDPVWLDPGRYQQVVWNLMTNAMKFSNEGGQVHVRLAREGERLVLEVQDHGQGIEPAFIPHVFDRFTQGDSPGNRRHGGLGLGLSIVKHLVDLHGGEVRAHSGGLGTGATMRVELPVQAATDDAGAGESEFAEDEQEFASDDLKGLDVLVVEDDREAGAMMSAMLSERGAQVRIAKDVAAALHEIAVRGPDVLVSDVGLPGRDGYELMRVLRSREAAAVPPATERLPSIALTAFARPQDIEKAINAGFDLHLSKPVRPHRLVGAIRALRPG